jgi:sortase A
MRDKRPVDELSIEELERILAVRKRESRLARARRYGEQGRVLPLDADALPPDEPTPDAEADPIFEESIVHSPIATSADDPAATPTKIATDAVAEPEESTLDPEAKPVTASHFEGDPRFEDEEPRPAPKPRPARQRLERRKMATPIPPVEPPPLIRVAPSARSLTASARSGRAGEPRAPLTPRAKLWNGFLTVVEIAAVFGLVALGVVMWQTVQALQQQTADQQATSQAVAMASFVPPTPTPIVSIPVKVLPTGHKYLGNGQSEFNLDEVPAEYRAQYASYLAQLPRIRPTQSPEGPVWVRIPTIRVDNQVVYGDDPEALKQGVGHHIGSANPGQVGNMVLSAHNDVYGELFRDLEDLKPGDEVVVKTLSREYTYVVQEITKVNPSDVWVLEGRNDRRLTLISCWPYRVNTKRIVVFATLAS